MQAVQAVQAVHIVSEVRASSKPVFETDLQTGWMCLEG